MQKSTPDIFFDASPDDTITLLNGNTIPLIYVTFVPATYQFIYTYGGNQLDVTYLMTAKQKQLFPGYIQEEWNARLSNIRSTGVNAPNRLETSTWSLFKDNVVQDVKAKTTLGVGSLGATLGLVLGGYIIFKFLANRK